MHQANFRLVIRAKRNYKFTRQYSHNVDKTIDVQFGQIVTLDAYCSDQGYPEPLRLIRYYESGKDEGLVFIANDYIYPVTSIAGLSNSRWHNETFIKWIKQPFCLKVIYGKSENAIILQIWIAVSIFLVRYRNPHP